MSGNINRSFDPGPPQVAALIKGSGDKKILRPNRSNMSEFISGVEIAGLVILLSLAILVILPG
jgi:hypothetical protein